MLFLLNALQYIPRSQSEQYYTLILHTLQPSFSIPDNSFPTGCSESSVPSEYRL